jgi:hypothetical protein
MGQQGLEQSGVYKNRDEVIGMLTSSIIRMRKERSR